MNRRDRPETAAREPLRPEEVLTLAPEEADRLLERLERTVPVRPGLASLSGLAAQEAIVFGDSHGDWRAVSHPRERFLQDPAHRCLIGLGDYVDRAPADLEGGSVANALSLLDLEARYPDRVLLLVGNHDLARRIPALPHDLPEEIDELWGPDSTRYDRLLGLLERGPLAAVTGNGVYLAHAGFPRGAGEAWRSRLEHPSDDTLIDLTWSDCAASGIDRGLGRPFDEPELRRFLASADCHVFLRGHDPPLTGRPLYHGTLLTLHTTRTFAEYGGLVYATLPMDRPVRSTADITVERFDGGSGPVAGPGPR